MYKIGIDGHMLGDHSGGNESYYSNILRYMVVPKDCKVYLFVKPDVDVSEYEGKFEIIQFKSKNALLRNFWELTELCKKYELDLLHTQYFIPFVRPCKVVCTIHDICFEHYKDIFTKKEYYRQKILVPYAAKYSTYVFTVSNHAKKDIVEHYGILPSRTVVTYNAVNDLFRVLSESELNNEELRTKFQIGNVPYVLSVCNLQPRKNLVRLIRSFILMKKKYGGFERLVIVGKKAWMFNDILKTALEGNADILFTDYVCNKDLIRLYNAADCFVYPSFFEGFGIPPLEAMACGTPVVVSNATSLPEVVGDAGLYFDPYNEEEMTEAIHRMLIDTELKHHLREKGFLQVSKFSWKKSAKIITDIYINALNNIERKSKSKEVVYE